MDNNNILNVNLKLQKMAWFIISQKKILWLYFFFPSFTTTHCGQVGPGELG